MDFVKIQSLPLGITHFSDGFLREIQAGIASQGRGERLEVQLLDWMEDPAPLSITTMILSKYLSNWAR